MLFVNILLQVKLMFDKLQHKIYNLFDMNILEKGVS